ncbi:hypothetical protein TNCV_1551621 [Trichonephila clavipes]|nr:hypothetical protein TNCV_1551621 [Trichonephila clavipes]
MDLKAQKAQRRVLRTAVTLSANKIEKYYTRIDKKLGETVISEVPDTPRKFKLPETRTEKIRWRPEGVPFVLEPVPKIHDDGSIPMKTRCSILWLQLNQIESGKTHS